MASGLSSLVGEVHRAILSVEVCNIWAQTQAEGTSLRNTSAVQKPYCSTPDKTAMAQNLFLLVSMVMVCLAASVRGTSHLMFGNSSQQQVNATRTGCGATKICVDVPTGCDPAVAGSCLFASIVAGPAVAPNGTTLNITLRGETTGYIAIGLNATMGAAMVFVCGRQNATFRFFTREQTNSMSNLTPTERQVKNILSNINDSVVKCEFTVPNVNATQMRAADSIFAIILGNGTLDGTGVLGMFNVLTRTDPLDLTDPSSSIAQPTAIPATSATAFTSPASLLLWSSLAWTAVLRM